MTIQAHRAMLGDAWDLVVLLRTVKKGFIDKPAEPETTYAPPSGGIIATLALASYDLMAAFVAADRAFRKAHNLTTDPRHQRRVSTRTPLEAHLLLTLTDRQPAEAVIAPLLNERSRELKKLLAGWKDDGDAAEFSTPEWRALALLRLDEGDAGHELWARHRTLYQQRIREARRAWSRELGGTPTPQALCIIPFVGPYGGQL